jgi:hemoglobin
MTYFSKIGGAPAIDKIVEEFFARMETLPEARRLREMHADDLAKTKSVMKRYLSELLGGPQFSETRGIPALKGRHAGMDIGPEERDAWMRCMREALRSTVADEGLRTYIEERFYRLAEWIRNDEEKPQ